MNFRACIEREAKVPRTGTKKLEPPKWATRDAERYVALNPRNAEMSWGGISAGTTALVARAQWANFSGFTYRGERDMFRTLGYSRIVTPWDYRWRYERNGVAKRIVEAFPTSTWRIGGEVVENEDPEVTTAFEGAFDDLNDRLQLWATFKRLDIVAGLGRFGLLLIGAPGEIDQPLTSLSNQNLWYLTPFSERDTWISELNIDAKSPRYGLPVYYTINRLIAPLGGTSASQARRVHWTRVIHVADGMLDDHVYGQPRMQSAWNYLDDLDKVVGGGAEAFWKRADAGTVFNIDPELRPTPQDLQEMKEQIKKFTDRLERMLTLRGVEMHTQSSSVSNFSDPKNAIMALISVSTSIPQRILQGSERGELASSQDADEWQQRVSDRRGDYATPYIVMPTIQRFIDLGVLPTPKEYDVRWPDVADLNDFERAKMGLQWAQMNMSLAQANLPPVVTTNEIRDRVLLLPPMDETTGDLLDTSLVIASKWFKVPKRTRKFMVASKATQMRCMRAAAAKAAPKLDLRALETALMENDYKKANELIAAALAA